MIREKLDAAFAGEASVFEFTHEPSSRRIRTAFTPDETQGGVYILSMDVTEEAQTRAALQQTRRREMAAQLTSGMAHDFSNLLTIILGMQSKLQRMDLPEEASGLIAATLSAARRGGGLLNRIADMTGPREHTARPTNLSAFLSDLETLALSTLPDDVQFSINTLTDAVAYSLDTGMLQDSLLNLVINARDACGGFSEQALKHALDPFFTTKGGEGSGLGLSMVYDMTKLAGGRVHLSNTDRGGRVTIRLPLRVAEGGAAPGLVLLVEDSPDLRDTIREMLREGGHLVVEASSAGEALSLVRELPEISALLSDITLEGDKTGLDLLDALPEGHCPAYLMTSLPPDDPLHRAARKRAPVLRKPFAPAELEALLATGGAA